MQTHLIRNLTFILLLFIWGCSGPTFLKYSSFYHTDATNKIPNYGNIYYWASHPWKKDLGDSIPKPLQKDYKIDSTVDVFFLHPTTFTDTSSKEWNAPINDTAINAKTDYSSILYQATAFNEYRLFAPRYRQANIRAYYTKDTAKAIEAFNVAYTDVKAAFQFYLDNYNQGRPIVIASHSQGSTHAQRLLKEFFDSNNTLKNRLVVAYVVGMYMPATFFTDLKVCKDSTQTGCICGWRTFKKGYAPAYVQKEKGTGLVTNPLSWTTTADYAPNYLNKGSVLFNFNKIEHKVVNAQIHDGIIWVDKLHIRGGFLVKKKNFHNGDINLFYLNIREDIRRRVGLFWKR